jgi:hypothetical protein
MKAIFTLSNFHSFFFNRSFFFQSFLFLNGCGGDLADCMLQQSFVQPDALQKYDRASISSSWKTSRGLAIPA